MLLLLLLPLSASADLIVSVHDADVAFGQTGFVDVFVRSTAPGADVLDAFSLELRLTPLSGPASLQFTSPPLDPQLTSPNYVFTGNSLIAATPPAGTILSIFHPNDTYLGGDATLSGAGVVVPTTDTLLTRVQLTAANVPMLVSRFRLDVVVGPFTTLNGALPAATQFSYLASPGAVVVNAEPSSLAVWGSVTGLLALLLLRSGRAVPRLDAAQAA
jgi:hypothetical protein